MRRMRRLESAGVIRAHAALIEPAHVGYGVTAFIEVTLVNASGAEMAAFERRMIRCPEVVQCSELAGDTDYLLTVRVRQMQEFSDFTRTRLGDDRRIRSYRSLLVLRQLKNEHELAL
jgi:Lrp/AsnC family leucine-responsive transcriptional regulator